MDYHRMLGLLVFVLLAFEGTVCRATRLDDWLTHHEANTQHNSDDPRHGHVSDSEAPSLQPQAECHPVQSKFAELNLGNASLVPISKIHDPEMDICYKGAKDTRRKSCCSSHTERRYNQRAADDFHTVLQQTSAYLKNLLRANIEHYQDIFLSLLRQVHNNTENLFSEIYELPRRDSKGPVDALILDLEEYIKRKDVNVYDSIEVFFDALFPVVFHNNVNDPSTTELNDDYRECLMQVRQDLYPRPFGEVPSKLSHQLSKSLGSARAFLEALHLMRETLNATDHMTLDHRCSHALTRLEYCAHCEGHLDTRPCKGFCFNVLRGCLAYMADIDERWNEFVDALHQLTSHMRGQYDIEDVLHTFHLKVSDAVLHAMETGIKFNDKVKERCGQPRKSAHLRSVYDDETPESRKHHRKHGVHFLPQPPRLNTKLYSKMEMFMRNLIASKGFYHKLPDTLCSAERFSSGIDETCWNGEDLKPYNKSVVAMELVLQIDNPEVRIPDRTPGMVRTITDKLQHMKKLLSSRVVSELKEPEEKMQGDDWAASYQWNDQKYGSGYGHWSNYGSDGGYGYRPGYDGYPIDDDDAYYSGSGSGMPSIDVRTKPRPGVANTGDFTIDDIKKPTTEAPYITPKQPHKSNTSGSAQSLSFAPIVILTTSIVATASLWLNG